MNGLLKGFQGIPTTTLSDIMERSGMTNRSFFGFRQIQIDKKVVGTAVTVKISSGQRGDFEKTDFNLDEILNSVNEGDVLVFDNGGAPIACLGDMATLAMIQRGGTGAVIDGGVRDVDEIRAMGTQIIARHFVPYSGVTRMKLVSINQNIQCGGAHVEPGDIVVGDSSGVVFIPSGKAAEILKAALDVERGETSVRTAILAGLSFAAACRSREMEQSN